MAANAGKGSTTPVNITLESKLQLRSVGSRDEVIETLGVFKGVVSVGAVDGLAMELDASHGELAGKIRVIPSHVILAVDVLEAAEEKDEQKDDAHIHYT